MSNGTEMAYRRRQPSMAASVFWFLLLCAFVPAAFKVGEWGLGLVVLGMLILAAVRAVPRHTTPRQVASPQAPLQHYIFRRRCPHCGAPGRGATHCHYCGTSLAA